MTIQSTRAISRTDPIPRSRFLIYALVDPRTNQIRYIGKSSGGLRRPRQHRYPSAEKKRGRYLANWLASLRRNGLACVIRILEELSANNGLKAAEIRWIEEGRKQKWLLTNLTDGGEGVPGLRHTEATKKQISEKIKGTKRSAETCAKIGDIHRGKKLSEEQKQKLRVANKGKKQTPDTIAKRSAAIRGRHWSPEERNKREQNQKLKLKTHCIRGHLLSGDNLVGDTRTCRLCNRIRYNKHIQQKKRTQQVADTEIA